MSNEIRTVKREISVAYDRQGRVISWDAPEDILLIDVSTWASVQHIWGEKPGELEDFLEDPNVVYCERQLERARAKSKWRR